MLLMSYKVHNYAGKVYNHVHVICKLTPTRIIEYIMYVYVYNNICKTELIHVNEHSAVMYTIPYYVCV